MWLLGRLAPDFKTIADFRKDNGPAIKKVCARLVNVCREMGLPAKASVAIDGSKFKAVNNRDKNFTRAKVERRRKQLEESVARYLAQLDTADRQDPSEIVTLKTMRYKEKLEKLKSEMAKLAAIEKQVLASPDKQVSFTDPDSRSMATSGRGSGIVGYNVQTAVDTENHLIVAHEVTNVGSDRSQLANTAQAAKEALQVEKLEAVADRGYFNGEEIKACEDAGVTVTLPKPMTLGAKAEGRFGKQDFVYLAEEDVYRCPAGEQLTYRMTTVENGQNMRRYWTNACRACPLKAKCTKGPERVESPAGSTSRWWRRCRSDSREPRGDAHAARDGRASVRYTEDAHGRDALLVQDAAQGCDRDGALCARIQHDAGVNIRRHQAAARGHRCLRQPDCRLRTSNGSASSAGAKARMSRLSIVGQRRVASGTARSRPSLRAATSM